MAFREACWSHGRHPLADDPPGRAAQRDQRHPDRRHPRGLAHRRARPRRSCSPARPSSCPSCRRASSTRRWRCRCTSTSSRPRCRRCPRRCPIGVALVLIGMVLADELDLDRLPHVCCGGGRSGERARRPRDRPEPKVAVRGPHDPLRRPVALDDVTLDVRENEIFGIIGPGQQRQDLLPAGPEPHGRVHRRHEGRGPGALRRTGRPHLAQPLRSAPPHRGRLPAAGRPAAEHLRQRGLRPAARGRQEEGRPGHDRRALSAARRAVGRGEGPPRTRSAACSRAGSSSASRSPAPSPRSPTCCCSTSSPSLSTP